MNEPESLNDLLATDEMTRHFNWWGLSGTLLSDGDSLRYLQDSIGRARLAGAVPENVRNNFARVRKTFLYGLMEYDLFTVADDDARLVLEGALRERFVSLYDGKVTLIRGEETRTVSLSSFETLFERRRKGDLLLTRGGKHHGVPSGMSGLLRWARHEGLLPGQRSARSDKTMSKLRNYVAHPTGFHLLTPVDATRTLCRVAEFVNKLWGVDTPGGQMFPAPIERIPRAVVLVPDGRFVTFPSVARVREASDELRAGVFAVYLATRDEDLCELGVGGLTFRHRAGHQWTALPCDLLWGPGTWDELITGLHRFEDDALTDRVRYLDRVFLIRVDAEQIDLPRSPADFQACKIEHGTWYAIRADYPTDAFVHVRDHRERLGRLSRDGYCLDCPVTELGRFEDRAAVIAAFGPGLWKEP